MRSTLPTPTDVFAAVEAALKKPRTIDYLTFSGNGEPTIHPDFPEIVRGVKEIKGRLRPEAKLAILSNSSRVYDPEIAAALRLIDAPMMKLDAGDEATFRAINRPTGGLTLAMIREGLGRLPTLMIQSALIDGEVSNVRGEAFDAWVAALAELRPQKVHIYSAERPTAESDIKCVPPARLERIAEMMREEIGLDAQAFWRE
jgi:wyosine [tRNA(Phe)-imidazoG37] synthetase (radical SAM superfamily)